MLSCISRIVIYVTIVWLLFSCNTDKICNEDRISYLKIGLYSRIANDTAIKVKDSTVNGYSFYLFGQPEKVLYDSTDLSAIYLPLSQLADSSIFVIKFGNKSTDSFHNYTIKYKRSQVFINYECGFRTDFVLDSLLTSNESVDSLYINSRVVTDADEEHIKIFFGPGTSSLPQP